MSLYEYDAYGNLMPVYFSPASNIQGGYSGTYNPAAMAAYAANRHLGERITPTFNLRYELIQGVLFSDFSVMFSSEEHTSELQSLMRISYAVFCLKKKHQ